MLALRPLAVAAALAASAFAPLAASAVQTAPPVTVTSCNADTQAPVTSLAFAPIEFGNVYLSFTNASAIPAKNVELLVGYSGTEQRLDADGTFAPGTRIDRSISTVPFTNASGVTCRVAKVTFSDGSTWNAEAQAPQTTAQL
jgi:hypothetical protein